MQIDGETGLVPSVESDMERGPGGETYVIRRDVDGFFIRVPDLEMP